MFSKLFAAPVSLLAILAINLTATPARAHDQDLMVYYGCDAANNRLTVKTLVSTEKPFDTGRDNLSFLWLHAIGMVMECSFESGDNIYVQSYYGDGREYGNQHVALYINNRELDRQLEFNPDKSQSVRITGNDDDNVRVTYSKK